MVEYLVLVYKGTIDRFQTWFSSVDTMTWWLYVLIAAVVIFVLIKRVR